MARGNQSLFVASGSHDQVKNLQKSLEPVNRLVGAGFKFFLLQPSLHMLICALHAFVSK